MTIALVDNGSLEPAAHLNLRRVAAGISGRTGQVVHAVSWRHSDRIAPASLDGIPAASLESWIRARVRQGERDFVLIPFFVSPQGAIGTALHSDLQRVQDELSGFAFTLAGSLSARDAILPIMTARILETIQRRGLRQPAAVLVDHGGPSPASAELRNELAERIRARLGADVSGLAAASMDGAAYTHNLPLLAEVLGTPGHNRGDVVIGPLFLSPGRHAGPDGDLERIARGAEDRAQGALRCHFTDLIGTHPLATDCLAEALLEALSTRRNDSCRRDKKEGGSPTPKRPAHCFLSYPNSPPLSGGENLG